MKNNRKRIVTAVVFAVTLVLGTTALALAWRLQQDDQITEEPASAADDWCEPDAAGTTYGYCSGEQEYDCGGDGKRTKCVNNVWEATGGCCDEPEPGDGTPSCSDNTCESNCGGSGCGINNCNISAIDCGYWTATTGCWGPAHEDWSSDFEWYCKEEWPTHDSSIANFPDWHARAGEDLAGRTPLNSEVLNDGKVDEKYWCTQIQADVTGLGGFTNVMIGDKGDYCYEYISDQTDSNGTHCVAPHSGATTPSELDWDCDVTPIALSGEVYCQDDGGEKFTLDGESITVVRNGLDTLELTTANGFTADLTGSIGFAVRLNGRPLQGTLSNGQSYSDMVGPTLNTKDYCQVGNNYELCDPTVQENHTNFDFIYTNCTPAIPEARCVSKTVSPTGTIDPGQDVTFTVNYENSGEVDGNVLITDTVPNGYENVAVTSPTTGCTVTGNAVSCSISAAAGTTGAVTITATTKSNIRDLNTNNTAVVTIDGDANTANNSCSTEVTPSEAGVACVSKDASPENAVNPGDIVAYTVVYTVERGPVTLNISEPIPQYLTILDSTEYPLPDGCSVASDTLTCIITETDTGSYENNLVFHAQVDETIPLAGTIIENTITVKENGKEPDDDAICVETVNVEHKDPFCIATTPSTTSIRVADISGTTVELTTRANIGSHTDLDFRWTTTGGTLSSTEWHASSGTPASGQVTDVITWTPPAGASEDSTYDLKVYVRPTGSSDSTGVSDDDCESLVQITALDLICNWLVPNNSYTYFPFDMTFRADIGGDEGALFTYDLDFGDSTTHYTGSGTVASGTTVELPYVPPQDQAHTYDNESPLTISPVLTVTNTENGVESVCPTVLGVVTQSEWTIVKDSDVDTCVAQNSTVTYSIVVTNTGDYTADLAQVRDTIDSKIDTSTITNIRECDSNGLNCTAYNKADILSGRTITWPGRTYTSGESRKYMYTVTINSAGDYYNVAEAIPEAGEIVRDDELFPTCSGKTPETGVFSTAVYIAIFGVLVVAGSYYSYKTGAGSQVVANAIGKTGRAVKRNLDKKQTFERDSIKASKDKLKS